MVAKFADPLVNLVSVCFQYPQTNKRTSGIHNVTFSVNSNDRVVIVGHNGSGKSTLLSLIAGRRKASRGQVTVLGSDAFDNTCLQQHVTLIGQPWPAEAFFATTVDKIASPAFSEERKRRIADTLHLCLQRSVGAMSSGEKRRVQILHGMLQQSFVYLLDECSTDIDIAERKTVLELVHNECVTNNACCVYATHILDGLGDWATHVALMQNGTVVDYKKISDLNEPLEGFVCTFLTKNQKVGFDFAAVNAVKMIKEDDAEKDGADFFLKEKEAVIVCNQLQYRDVFRDLSFKIYRGERVLLCGCNGAGKSTLLNMMGGKQFFNNTAGSLCILGKICYEDMTLNAEVALCGDWWTTAPPGEMYVHEMLRLNTPRAQRLSQLLAVDPSWDIRSVSAGEQKRIQLLFHLVEDRPVVLLDEATSDLDLDQRYKLLLFLYNESVYRGVTVVYATHIFGGLENWPSVVIMLDSRKKGIHAVWRGDGVEWSEITSELFALKNGEKKS